MESGITAFAAYLRAHSARNNAASSALMQRGSKPGCTPGPVRVHTHDASPLHRRRPLKATRESTQRS